MDGDAFERYIKTQLAPTLQKGVVVVLDNLPAQPMRRCQAGRREAWRLALVTAALLARLQSDRTRILKVQSPHEAPETTHRR